MNDNPPHLLRERHNPTTASTQANPSWSPADRRTRLALRDIRADARSVLRARTREPARDGYDHLYPYAIHHSGPTTQAA
jgi:hypothetical protein